MKNSLLYGQCFKRGATWADQDTKSRNLDWASRCQSRTKPREQETCAGSLSTEPEKSDLAQGRKSWQSGTVAKLSLSQFCWASWSPVPEEDVHSRTATLELIGQARLPPSEVLRDGSVMISTPPSGRYGTLYPFPPDAAARAPLTSSKAPGPRCPSHPHLLEELVGQQGPHHQHLTMLPASQTPAHHIAFTCSSPHLFPFTKISDSEVLLKAILKNQHEEQH